MRHLQQCRTAAKQHASYAAAENFPTFLSVLFLTYMSINIILLSCRSILTSTMDFRAQAAILDSLSVLAPALDLIEADIDLIAEACVPYLHSSTPAPLQVWEWCSCLILFSYYQIHRIALQSALILSFIVINFIFLQGFCLLSTNGNRAYWRGCCVACSSENLPSPSCATRRCSCITSPSSTWPPVCLRSTSSSRKDMIMAIIIFKKRGRGVDRKNGEMYVIYPVKKYLLKFWASLHSKNDADTMSSTWTRRYQIACKWSKQHTAVTLGLRYSHCLGEEGGGKRRRRRWLTSNI